MRSEEDKNRTTDRTENQTTERPGIRSSIYSRTPDGRFSIDVIRLIGVSRGSWDSKSRNNSVSHRPCWDSLFLVKSVE
jgi:hypothetical protein